MKKLLLLLKKIADVFDDMWGDTPHQACETYLNFHTILRRPVV